MTLLLLDALPVPLVVLELSIVLVPVIPAVVPVALLLAVLPLPLVHLSVGRPPEYTIAVLHILHVLPYVGVAIRKLIRTVTFLHVVLKLTPVCVPVFIGDLHTTMQ